ncbi:hypothetical protein PCO85_04245 [Prodigiosinella aquatilis]|nr:hypothetical protein [Prodigiosinella sp. LS101]WJV54664.1 hypothetical protein PCO85_04245 [Prodigiosinella sp. LS101]WJV59027.1 hypothetical protein PCO84_04260 [Pectobacteriaceae bacterium C111]
MSLHVYLAASVCAYKDHFPVVSGPLRNFIECERVTLWVQLVYLV